MEKNEEKRKISVVKLRCERLCVCRKFKRVVCRLIVLVCTRWSLFSSMICQVQLYLRLYLASEKKRERLIKLTCRIKLKCFNKKKKKIIQRVHNESFLLKIFRSSVLVTLISMFDQNCRQEKYSYVRVALFNSNLCLA